MDPEQEAIQDTIFCAIGVLFVLYVLGHVVWLLVG